MPASRRVRQVFAHSGEVLLRLQLAGYIVPCSGDPITWQTGTLSIQVFRHVSMLRPGLSV